jgi:acyl-CoA dehydrogenase
MTEKPQTARAIIESLPDRYNKEKGVEANYHTVFHFQIEGEEGGEFTVTINAEEIKVEEGLIGEAKCTVKTKASTYADIEWGRENAQMAFMWGKVKVNNITEMMTFSGMFMSVKKYFEN